MTQNTHAIDPRDPAGFVTGMVESMTIDSSLELRFGDCTIAVRSNSQQLVEALQRYYHDFLSPRESGRADLVVMALEMEALALDIPWQVKQPDPGKTKIKEEYLDAGAGRMVRKRLTGMIFYFDRNLHVALGPCLSNDNQVINFINSRYIQWMLDRGCLLCHAAGVSLRGAGLAMAGFSGMGKSTLALHLMHRGLDFVSNDRLLLRRDASGTWMHGVAKLPRVNPGTIMGNPSLAALLDKGQKAAYAAMDQDELWHLESKHDVFLDECFGQGKFVGFARMTGLVILNWKPKYPRTSLELVNISERDDLLDTVIKSPGLFFLPDPDIHYDFQRRAYQEALAGCQVFEAGGGVDFDYVSTACIHFLDQHVAK
jgi:HprK-related kinase B